MVNLLFPLLALTFLILGIYGLMCAISRMLRGYTGFFIFTVRGAVVYLTALLVSSALFLYAMQHMSGLLVLFLFAIMPFAILGHVLWGFGLIIELFGRAAGPSDLPVARTFDKGDMLMSRGRVAEAEAQYRRDLAEEPLNLEALLRVSRALEAQDKAAQAMRELELAYRITAEGKDLPPLKAQVRSERLLLLTFALGDLFATKLQQPQRARKLYEESLQLLYGFPQADPLRDRLRLLENMAPTTSQSEGEPEAIQL